MSNLFDPLIVGHLTLKNRIVMPPMANELASEEGEVTEALITHYTRRAPGVGLVIVEHSYVSLDGKAILETAWNPRRRFDQGTHESS